MSTNPSSTSPKVTAATLAAAIASIVWVLIATFSPDTFDDTALASLQGGTTTVLTFLLGYLVTDTTRQEVRPPRARADS
jgi:hypothetical protein